MISKYLFIIIAFFSFSFSGILDNSTSSIGVSETMGIYGFWNRNFHLNDNFFITAGAFVIPFTGGAGLGYRHSFNYSRVSPFASTAIFGIYAIPIMCGTDNCETKTDHNQLR